MGTGGLGRSGGGAVGPVHAPALGTRPPHPAPPALPAAPHAPMQGMDEMEFTEAESNMNDLVSEYQQYQGKDNAQWNGGGGLREPPVLCAPSSTCHTP